MNFQKREPTVTMLSKELWLMIDCLTAEKDKKCYQLRSDDINWQHFLELVWHHRVYPLVYRNLSKTNAALVPPWVLDRLAQRTRQNGFKMVQLTAELEQLLHIFEQQHIQSLLLKGPALAIELYGELSLRPSRDLDLLIQQEDLQRVEQILVEAGYQANSDNVTYRQFQIQRHHHFEYFHPGKKICIEIHWRQSRDYHQKSSFAELWERRRMIRIANQPVYCLGEEDLFLYLVSHGARHAWFRLRWLEDIDRLLRKGLDWNGCLKQLNQKEMQALVGQALCLSHALFHSVIPQELHLLMNQANVIRLSSIAIRIIEKQEDPTDINIFGRDYYLKKYYNYLLNTSFKRKMKYVVEHLYPSLEDTKMIPLPPSLRRIYLVIKPFLWLWRHSKSRFVKPRE